MRRSESGSHFSNEASKVVGQIVYLNLIGLGPSRCQVDCMLEGFSFLQVKVLKAAGDKQFNICIVNFTISHVQQESSELGFILSQNLVHEDRGGPGGD